MTPTTETRGRPESHQHGTTLTLASGDILVVTTDYLSHESCEPTFKDLIRIDFMVNELVEPFVWQVTTPDLSFIAQQDNYYRTGLIQITPFSPFQTFNHPKKGPCVKFFARITHGYRLHFLNYVERKIPQVFHHIAADKGGLYAPILSGR